MKLPADLLFNPGLRRHLLRGLYAVALVAAAYRLSLWNGYFGYAIGLLAVIGAAILLRGCPICWVLGLASIIKHRHKE